ncbi:pentapeptide repeat-containing protein [Phytomonospora sp. NPDC050363]|uniref:pentapeptide repeat-containing protein n=1 Tax=Phytomonospora sp. NPDC050363 TaxID=3155642 RepID=UPI0033E72DB8
MGAEQAVARIHRGNGGTAGLAFLVAGGRLATCAHVVNTALGRRDRRDVTRPEGVVRLRFAFAPAEVHSATIAEWLPSGVWGDDRDLAILALAGPPPDGLPELAIAETVPDSPLPVQLCGPDTDRLKHVLGTLVGATGNGLRQIDQRRSGAHLAHAGFSGGPVWNGDGEVVGVLRAVREGNSDADCIDPGWLRERLTPRRPERPEGVVDILQIGPLRLAESTAAQQIEDLLSGIASTCSANDLAPDVVVFCGDLTASASAAEYRLVAGLVERLRSRLALPAGRVLTVPGPADVNARLCETHFVAHEVMEEAPVPPYWDKWLPYSKFLSDVDGEPLARDLPWRMLAVPELRLVLAGMNSTMAHSHRPADARAEFGEQQSAWFAGQLAELEFAGWKKVAVTAELPPSAYADGFAGRFGGRLDLVLAGSAEVERVGEIPVVVPGESFRVLRLVSTEDAGSEPADDFTVVLGRRLAIAASALASVGESVLDRVVTALEYEYPDADLRPVRHAPVPYVRVIKRYRSGDRLIPSDELLIGVEPREATVERIDAFRRLVDRFHTPGTKSVYPFVYFGGLATADAAAFGQRHQILLQSFADFQYKWDPRHFTGWQLRELDADGRYPAGLYIPQRFTEFGPGDVARAGTSAGLTERVIEWFGEDQSHLIVVLGSAGTGKTFFMRMLAREMSASASAPTPVYLQLRDLERIPLLDELVARQFAKAREHRLPVDRFNYYLREGRIALLLDGLDELTVQGGWDKAIGYLTEIREKVTGKAMIVVTARDEEFLSNREVERVLRQGTGSIGRRSFRIERFTFDQVARFLERLLGSAEAADERLELLRGFGSIPEVARNPRMLSFIAGIEPERLRRAREASHGGGLNSAELYRQVIEQWKDREEERLRRDDQAPALDRTQLWEAVSRLAVNLWRTGREALTVDELGDAAQVLSHVDTQAQVHQISSGSLLVRGEDGKLGFIHRSVLEWFVAEAVVRDPDIAEAMGTLRLSDQAARFVAEMKPEVPLRAPEGWAPADPRIATYQANAGLASKYVPGDSRGAWSVTQLDYTGANLEGFNSEGQTLVGTSFRRAHSPNADFRGKDLTRTDWTGANLRGADFSGAVLKDAILDADLTGAKLLGADLTGARLAGAKLDRAALTGAKVTPEQLAEAETVVGAALPEGRLTPQIRFSAGEVAAVDPRRSVLATGDGNGWVQLWSLPELSPIRSWRALPGGVRALAWSSDGARLLVGGDGPLCCWHGDGTLDWSMGDNLSGVSLLAWNRVDGRIACVRSSPSRLDVVDGHLGVVPDLYKLGPLPIAAIGWSPDGTTLAIAAERGGEIHLAQGRRSTRHRLAPDDSRIWSLAWSPSSTRLAIGFAEQVRILDLAAMKASSFSTVVPSARALAWSPGEEVILVGDGEGGGNEYFVGEGSPRRGFGMGTGPVTAVAYLDDDGFLVHTAGGTQVLSAEFHSLSARRSPASIRSAAWSADGRQIIAADATGVLRLWEARQGTVLWARPTADSRMLTDWSPIGHTATADLSGAVTVIPGGGHYGRAWQEPAAVFALRWSADSRHVAVGGQDGVVRLRDPLGTLIREWRLRGRVNDLGWDGAGVLYAIGTHGLARYGLASPGADWEISAGSRIPNSLSLRSQDQSIAVGLKEGGIRLHGKADGRLEAEWAAHTGGVTSLSHSLRGDLLASGGEDGMVRLWHGQTLRQEWSAHAGRVTVVDHSPDGRHLLTAGDDGVLRVWDHDGELTATLIPLENNGSAAVTGGVPDFKLDGELDGEFWCASGQVAIDRLDLLKGSGLRRLRADEPLWDRASDHQPHHP